jgi:hypothetical protein
MIKAWMQCRADMCAHRRVCMLWSCRLEATVSLYLRNSLWSCRLEATVSLYLRNLLWSCRLQARPASRYYRHYICTCCHYIYMLWSGP